MSMGNPLNQITTNFVSFKASNFLVGPFFAVSCSKLELVFLQKFYCVEDKNPHNY